MNISSANTFKAINFNKTQRSFSESSEKKSADKTSTFLTEKYEPSLKEKPMNKSIAYNFNTPVVKSDSTSKSFFEIINYTDLPEKFLSESQKENIIIQKYINTFTNTKNKDEIGSGFYLTIPQSDLKKLSGYVKENQNKVEQFNSSNRIKKGVLVNLVV